MSEHRVAAFCAGVALVVGACGSSSPQSVEPSATPETVDPAQEPIDGASGADHDGGPVRCIVRLHGKGGSGGDTSVDDRGIRNLMPSGNEEGWGGRQWLYFPGDRYDEARDVVSSALRTERCGVAVINGFSNGASFAAAMLCSGETFDDVVQGYVIDDPVTDTATAGCSQASGIELVLYWTSAVDQAVGTDCGEIDWTCAGGTTVDVQTYADDLGTAVVESPNTEHSWYWNAPEVVTFLGV